MSEIWQNIPSMAFMQGLYQGITTIGAAKRRGNFGVGQFAALDGELIVNEGAFYRATSDGNVRLADDSDQLCFAQLCIFSPQHKAWEVPPKTTYDSFGKFLNDVYPTMNSFCAFRITGMFANVVPTSPPAFKEPFPPFSEAKKMRKSFPKTDIQGSLVGYFSPPFTASVGVPGYHFHFISDDRLSGGHVEEFTLASGCVHVARINDFVLILPESKAYQECDLSQPTSATLPVTEIGAKEKE